MSDSKTPDSSAPKIPDLSVGQLGDLYTVINKLSSQDVEFAVAAKLVAAGKITKPHYENISQLRKEIAKKIGCTELPNGGLSVSQEKVPAFNAELVASLDKLVEGSGASVAAQRISPRQLASVKLTPNEYSSLGLLLLDD